MSIIFKKIKWKNFLSTGNIYTELDLNTHNTSLIIGENGAGKSTILDALTFGLFNKPFRKINKPQLMNSITKKDLMVEIDFTIGKHDYKVVRGIKPNVFELYKDDILLNQDASARDYQEVLEKQILRINYKSFCQVVVLGSASFVPFMQLPAQSRREIIEDLLDLQIFTVMNLLLKDKITQNNSSINECSNEERVLKSKIDMTINHVKRLNQNNESIIADKKEKIQSYNALIESEFAVLNENKSKCEELKEQLLGHVKAQQKKNKIEKLKHGLSTKKISLDKTISFFHENDNCPTCKQSIDIMFREHMLNEKNNQKVEIEEAIVKLLKEYDKVVSDLTEFDAMNKKMTQFNLDISKSNIKINGWNENITELQKDIRKLEKQTRDDVANLNVEDMKLQLKKIEIQFNALHDEKQTLMTAASILKDGGIKSKIIKQYIPIINKFINKYLTAMDFFVQFELDEQFNETIKSRYRDEFSYSSFSEGEKMRINLAILFTWRAISKLRNSVNTNLLIMDEVFDSSLDSNGTEEFLKIIQSLTGDANIFIISHKTDQLSDKFDKVIRFEKHKNFSKMIN